MNDTLKSWFGAEPFLGLIVLAIALPLAGIAAYFVAASLISAPLGLALIFGPWLLGMGIDRLRGKDGELRRTVAYIWSVGVIAAAYAYLLRDWFDPWPGDAPTMAAKLLMVAAISVATVELMRRTPVQLPDYRAR